DDERFVHHHGEVAGEDGVFGEFHRFQPHDFSEPGKFTQGDFADSFGRDVTQGHAGAPGGENEMATFADLLANGALNVSFFVRHERICDNCPAIACGGLFQGWATEVVVEAFGGAIGNGDDAGGDLHGGSRWSVVCS